MPSGVPFLCRVIAESVTRAQSGSRELVVRSSLRELRFGRRYAELHPNGALPIISMLRKELGFRDSEVLHGTAVLPGGEGVVSASLTLNPSRFAVLAVDRRIGRLTSPEMGSKIEIIQFNTSEGQYALLDVQDGWSQFFPAVVVLGPAIERIAQLSFSSVHLAYSNLTKWVAGRSFPEFAEKEVVYKLVLGTFKERVEIGGRQMMVGLSYHPDWKSEDNEKKLLERVTIDCAPLEGRLSIEDCRNLERDFSLIITFLIGMPSTCEFMTAILEEALVYVAYPIAHSADTLSADRRAIHDNRRLCENGKWSAILKNYFTRRERFGRLWSRVFALMNYRDIWDYRVLGYVSVLQNYVDQTQSVKGPQLPKIVRDSLREQARVWVEGARASLRQHELHRPEWETILDEMKLVFGRYSFGIRYGYVERFERLLAGMDVRLVEVLGFCRDDFAFLKERRDNVGHATDVFDQRSVQRLTRLEPKLVLLILCLIYQDLGMKADDIIQAYSRTINQFVLDSDLSQIPLDRFSGRVRFVEAPAEILDRVRFAKTRYVVLERRKSTDEIRFNETNSRLVFEWHRDSRGFRLLRDYVRVGLYGTQGGVEIPEQCGAPAYLESAAAGDPVYVHGLVEVSLADAEWQR